MIVIIKANPSNSSFINDVYVTSLKETINPPSLILKINKFFNLKKVTASLLKTNLKKE